MERVPTFIQQLVERAGKTFLQFYLGFWLLTVGVLDTAAAAPGTADAFDTLFTVDNVKAGVVGLALSVATSAITRPIGRKDDPSVV